MDNSQPPNASKPTAHYYQDTAAKLGSQLTWLRRLFADTQKEYQGGTPTAAQITVTVTQPLEKTDSATLAAEWHKVEEAYLAQPPAQPPDVKKALNTRRLPHRSGIATLTKFCNSFLCFTGIGSTSTSAQPSCTEHYHAVPMSYTDSTVHKCCHLLYRLEAEKNLRGQQAKNTTAALPPARANHAAHPHPNQLHATREKTTSPHTYIELSGKAEIDTNNQPKPPANANAPTAHQKEAQSLMLQMLLLLLYVCTKLCSKLLDCCTNYTTLSCILFVETATTPMRRFLLLTVLHISPCQENSSCQSRLFCDTVYADEQVPLGESYRGMSLNIHCNTAACCCN